MSQSIWPWLVLMTSALPGLVIFFIPETRRTLRSLLNVGAALVKLQLVGLLLLGLYAGESYHWQLPLLPGLTLSLKVDALAGLFLILSAVLWLLTTLYAIGYLEHSPHRSRFFGFFSLCVSATAGVAMSANLFTFVVFYELLTLATWPLVVHRGTPQALAAGRVYLRYTLVSGSVLLLGAVTLHALVGTPEFVPGGYVSDADVAQVWLWAVFVLLLIGLGVKAALVPLHGWLPRAMVAPAPVSALLHAVAVVKAGAFGIVRVMFEVFGIEFAADLGMADLLLGLAALTIVYGSWRALFESDLKKRLAFSTVSQVSYVALGVALAGPLGAIGGLIHIVHQGVMKITLFLAAGNYAETLGVHKVSELSGVGRRMPWTTAAFTLGALGMIGFPPLAGFVSKWYLGLGAWEAEANWVLAVLLVSGLLNAAYFLPLLYRAWFESPPAQWPQAQRLSRVFETHALLLFPPLVTASLVVLLGVLAGLNVTSLGWVQWLVKREFAL
ncbi:complex I subunit 5 family protein [Thiomicrospira sp. WB1]|uniref:complex I subunit 5 family protein n=1 Tax=Thiomicrospira sp. WB1 TaxID=1685380 RepID=UPI000748AEDC|nr:proton-conducting transporter membrane subunit [Thiomicrospira sp. WB1]KUJ71085.1 NADH dehydrogenase [Thiomicrospira sp. WB1]